MVADARRAGLTADGPAGRQLFSGVQGRRFVHETPTGMPDGSDWSPGPRDREAGARELGHTSAASGCVCRREPHGQVSLGLRSTLPGDPVMDASKQDSQRTRWLANSAAYVCTSSGSRCAGSASAPHQAGSSATATRAHSDGRARRTGPAPNGCRTRGRARTLPGSSG